MSFTQEKLTELLEALEANAVVYVTFRTKAGTTRVMDCSRQLSAIPEENHVGQFDKRLIGESIMTVYDFQNSAWRSFRKDSVIGYTIGIS